MTRVQVRPYLLEEFDEACIIRNLSGEESKERFKKAFEKPDGWNDHYRHFGIVFRDELVGDLQIRQCLKTMPDGVAELGIEVLETFRSRGIASAALVEVANILSAEGFYRLQGSTEIDNGAMRKAFEKAGFRFEGIQESLFIEDGIARDYASYALICKRTNE